VVTDGIQVTGRESVCAGERGGAILDNLRQFLVALRKVLRFQYRDVHLRRITEKNAKLHRQRHAFQCKFPQPAENVPDGAGCGGVTLGENAGLAAGSSPRGSFLSSDRRNLFFS
jgi:hypothetical protein